MKRDVRMTVSEARSCSDAAFSFGALFVLAAGLSWSFTGFSSGSPRIGSWQFLIWRNFGVACAFGLS